VTFVLSMLVTPLARSGTWPTSRAARVWHPDRGWLRGAFCIHRFESGDWHRDHVDWLGRWSPYSGGLQFLPSTWRSAGGAGDAWQWSPREQLYRAYVVWRHDGSSWSEWGTRLVCGLR
jgi:hypothetical protein